MKRWTDDLMDCALGVILVALLTFLALGIACEIKYLLTDPEQVPDGRRCLRQATEIVADLPPQKRRTSLIFWTDDKIVLEETWTRPQPGDEPE